MHLYPHSQLIHPPLHQRIPLDVPQRIIRRGAEAPIVIEKLAAFAQGGAVVADDFEERVGVPSEAGGGGGAGVVEGFLGAQDDAGEEVEVLGEVADFGAEGVVVCACFGEDAVSEGGIVRLECVRLQEAMGEETAHATIDGDGC